jgi:hypothetical protein
MGDLVGIHELVTRDLRDRIEHAAVAHSLYLDLPPQLQARGVELGGRDGP